MSCLLEGAEQEHLYVYFGSSRRRLYGDLSTPSVIGSEESPSELTVKSSVVGCDMDFTKKRDRHGTLPARRMMTGDVVCTLIKQIDIVILGETPQDFVVILLKVLPAT